MSQVKTNSRYKPRKWYNSHRFPLIPVLDVKEASEHNTAGFTFEWLFLKVWTLDTPSFELSLVCSGHWGIGVIGILPYLRWVFAIPLPHSIDECIYKYLSRKPKSASL